MTEDDVRLRLSRDGTSQERVSFLGIGLTIDVASNVGTMPEPHPVAVANGGGDRRVRHASGERVTS